MHHLALVGMMGVGKSSMGRKVARKIGWEFIDCDSYLAKAEGQDIPEIFNERGEAEFRLLEHKTLTEVLSEPDPTVIATGGGVVLSEKNRKLLKQQARVIWLYAPPRFLADRLANSKVNRPLLAETDKLVALERIFKERKQFYKDVAHIQLDVQKMKYSQLLAAIIRASTQ